jgi:hypothetical protein
MSINLFVEPRKIYSWQEFKKTKEHYSIAVDGFVDAPTKRDLNGPYANFDHHSGTDRLATRSTSEQIHMEINLGLFDTFKKEGLPHANVYLNDCDEDACLAWWLLKNNDLVKNHANPSINRLVFCEDKLDCTAGAYPFGDIPIRRKLAWIFEPYYNARFQGKIAQMNSFEMKDIIEAVEKRINEHIINGGQELSLEGHYDIIGGGPGWKLIKEIGPASRMAMFADGIVAYIALLSENSGSYVYTIGRRSVWSSFDINKLYDLLNIEESNIITDDNKWGGSNTVGGSPRKTGSKLPPQKLQEIINSFLLKK